MAFNGRFVLNVSAFAGKLGADMDALIQASGQTEAALSAPDSTIDRQAYSRVVELAVEMTGDQCLGLHLGEGLGLSAAGLIGQITQTSRTVKEALTYCCEFANLGCSELPMELTRSGDYYKIRLQSNPLWEQQSPTAYRHTAEGVLVFTIRECEALTRDAHRPVAVHLPWKQAAHEQEYQRIFGTQVRFQQNEFAILLHPKQVEAPTTTSDYNLLRLLVAHAEEKSAQWHQQRGFSNVVRQSMIQLVRPEFPTIEQVAQHLNLSLRTLQRRLSEEGLTYKQLMEEVRKDFAQSYLRKPELSITEISYLLGYADTSAFSRAFKRWFERSPQQWRSEV